MANPDSAPAQLTLPFVTKDTGARQVYESGMMREPDADKPKPDLAFEGPMFDRWVGLLTRGAAKYEDNNWMKACGTAEYNRFRRSAVRHFMQWLRGDTDEDHAAAVFFNINGVEYINTKGGPK